MCALFNEISLFQSNSQQLELHFTSLLIFHENHYFFQFFFFGARYVTRHRTLACLVRAQTRKYFVCDFLRLFLSSQVEVASSDKFKF